MNDNLNSDVIVNAKLNIHNKLKTIDGPITFKNLLSLHDLVASSYWQLKDKITDTINEYDNCNELSSLTFKLHLDKSNMRDSIIFNFMILYGIAETLSILNYPKSDVTKLLRNIDNAFELIKLNISDKLENALLFSAVLTEIETEDKGLLTYILPKGLETGYPLLKWTFNGHLEVIDSIETAYATGFITDDLNLRTQLSELIKLHSISKECIEPLDNNLNIEY